MAIHEFLAGFESLLCSKGYGIPNGIVTSAESRTLFNGETIPLTGEKEK